MASLQALQLSPTPQQPVAGVRLFFLPTRTRVSIEGVTGIEGSLTGVANTFPLIHVTWRLQTVTARPTVQAHVRGEPLVLKDFQWVPGSRTVPSPEAVWFIDAHDTRDERRAYIKRLLRSRDQGLERIDDSDLRDQAGFFRALDVATNPAFEELSPEVAERIDVVATALVARVRRRGRSLVECQNPAPPDLEPVAHQDLEFLTTLQQPLYERFFGQPVDVLKVGVAFEAFANGDLRPEQFQGWNGEPDSALFFAFAEFAIACVQARPAVAEAFWGPLLRPLVLAQEIYLARYRPVGKPPYRWEQYDRWNRAHNARVEPVLIGALRDRYRHTTMDDLLRAHAANAGMISGVNGHAPH